MRLLDRSSFFARLRSLVASALFELQLLRLRLDRALGRLLARDRGRVLATACWSFPIYSQTFVYQELTQLIRAGFGVRFVYSHRDRTQRLSPQFASLWRSRRRLILEPVVCQQSYERYARRMPERVAMLVELLGPASGLTPEQLREHHHFRQAFAFARMVEAYRPDYLHSYFFYEGTLFAFVASFLLNVPRGVSCYADHMIDDYSLKVVGLHLRHCSVVIATSQRIKEELRRLEPRTALAQILVKPNGINVDQFPAVTRQGASAHHPWSLVCVSRIEPKKGLLYLIEAIGRLRDRNVGVRLGLIGGVDDNPSSREYHREVTARIAALDLGDIVRLEGRRSEAEIQAAFAAAHLFVAPFVETATGDKDGIPTSILEAMASGLPVVATDSGSITEVIDHGIDGYIVAQRDAEAMAHAIEHLLADADQRTAMGARGAAKVRERFSAASGELLFHQRLTALLTSGGHPARRPLSPVVSVVIIFLNAEAFIRDAIESVLLQSYDHWELILVDDGSTDRSTEIARRFASADRARIRYVEHAAHRNLGMSASRNAGVLHAAGAYIAFLDADDVWLPWKLAQQVAILESEPAAALAFGAAEYWHGWTGRDADLARDTIPSLGLASDRLVEPPSLAIDLYPLGTGTPPGPSDFMVRREVYTQLGGFEEEFRGERQLYEDQAFLAKIYLNHPVYVSSESWIRYRIHPDSCMARVAGSGRYLHTRRYFLDWLQRYLDVNPRLQSAALREAVLAAQRDNQQAVALVSPSPAASNGLFSTLRRLTPISTNWGFDRGRPVDRYFIEQFLARHADDIQGHVLEVEDNLYTTQFGAARVRRSDVLHVAAGNPRATLVGDLTCADHLPSNTFDCIILTQVLQLIFDTRAALTTLHRILTPGGVVLATFPGISRISQTEWAGSWFWQFTTASARRHFEGVFTSGHLTVAALGNVLTSTAFLHGIAAEELTAEELEYRDPDYEMLITVRAVKAAVHDSPPES